MAHQNRRQFVRVSVALAGFGLIAGCGTLPIPGQPTARSRRIGYLSASSPPSSPFVDAFRQGLRELGWVEGQNIAIEYRFAERPDQVSAMAADLVSFNVEVIVAGGSLGIRAARDATTTIPIVMANSDDAVGSGFVASLSRPGGTVTGLTQISPQLDGKRLDLLRQTIPGLSHLGVLWNPAHPATPLDFKEIEDAARILGLQVQSLEVQDPEAFEAAFQAATREHASALSVIRDPFMISHEKRVAELAVQHRLPTIFSTKNFVQAGGLMAYGPSLADLFRRAAAYVDKILNGAKPADLPVEQPNAFDLVINLKTAQALSLAIPQSVLAQATEVIQ
jgi:putative ABC transport system substrate-binding protein